MEQMTLREKIGHMIMTGFPAEEITPSLGRLIDEYKVSNIILFSYNLKDKGQILRLCVDLQNRIRQSTGYPALIATDQEGGVVTRLPDTAANIPGAMLLCASGRREYACEAGRITGAELKTLGINMDLAPVLDIYSNPRNPVIGVRSYSSNVKKVEGFGMAMMKGLLGEGVAAVAKHFPGHGDTSVDSHLGLPVVEKGLEELMAQELIPFESAIKEGIPCIMTSHILFPKLEREKVPATMSKTILTDILRERLGFKGVIITDCLEMGAVKDNYGTARGAVMAVKAGAQLLCISHTPELVMNAVQQIEEAVLTGEIPMEFIDQAVDNVLKLKEVYKIDKNQKGPDEKDTFKYKRIIEEMTLSGITKLSKGSFPKFTQDTIFIGSYNYRSTLAGSTVGNGLHFAEYMAGKMNSSYLKVPINPGREEIEDILKKLKGYSFVIYGLYNGHLNNGQTELANTISSMGHTVLGITLRNPYDLAFLDKKIYKLAAYEYNAAVFNTLVKILKEEAVPGGKLPVQYTV
ncbi:MAG: glycoside hydrolase family 3 protein [Anaerocolumna sp.]